MNTVLLQTYYTNPIVNDDFPDPSVISVKDKGYFAYATHDDFSPTINNILLRHSWDLVNWTTAKGALLQPPLWAMQCNRFWCPQVTAVEGEYRLYYAAEPDTKDGMCLALATSATPESFCDIGNPLAGMPGSTYQMIDPFFFTDPKSGRHLLYYGSAHEPIRVVETAEDGKTFITQPAEILWPQPDTPFEMLREGAYITYHPKYDSYFMWVSGDNTWDVGAYAVSVFWSKDPVSNFIKIPGNHIVLKPNAHWGACGQNCIVTDAVGNDWIIYHAVDAAEPFIRGTDKVLRKMCMDRVLYSKEGWPYIQGGSPSFSRQPGPVISTSADIIKDKNLSWQIFDGLKKESMMDDPHPES